jgi:thymidylate synthase (FAD)
VAREQARKDLPVSTYTEAYWKIDLHNLFNFLALRMDEHAQEEIRRYATVIGEQIVATWCPLAWEAFVDYSLESMMLSKIDREIITLISAGRTAEAVARAQALGNRERRELEQKLQALAIAVPWA